MIVLVLSVPGIHRFDFVHLMDSRLVLERKGPAVFWTRTSDDGCLLTLLILPNTSGAVTNSYCPVGEMAGASRTQIAQSDINLFLAENKAYKETWR